ncbi:MAG: hypothetical protein DRQ14_06755 [Candidatus Latescibacterota bacterium]|nr:MAG: hypothetical protein DRQ14_06755 [Candidatus Latescibacterota bacterium]HDH99419.1 hypothetical protein [Bacillota bacterium]
MKQLVLVFLLFVGDAVGATGEVPGGPGEPAILFTYVPPYGSFEDLRGQVLHVRPEDYMVAVYICVDGLWWSKPYLTEPLTPIREDGSWICDITTGGHDQDATRIVAYLVPKGYAPPPMSGGPTLPPELEDASAAKVEVTRQEGVRTISFSGYTWRVKASESPLGPGPNYFSDSSENVWVDAQGQLHLKVTERDGRWYCAEVVSEGSFGYGAYDFYLASRIDKLDRNVVLGLFTWDDAPEGHHREIDIEFSRWGRTKDDNAQFVVQPWDRPGNMHRFNLQLDGDLSAHCFVWRKGCISFRSIRGHLLTSPDIIESWDYEGPDLPEPGNEKVRMNLWLLDGVPPSGDGEVEVVVRRFEFVRPVPVEETLWGTLKYEFR